MSTITDHPRSAETAHRPAAASCEAPQLEGLEPVFPESLRPGDRYAAIDAAEQVRTGTVVAGGLAARPGVDYYLLHRARLACLPASTPGWAQRARDGAWLVGSTDEAGVFHSVRTEGINVWRCALSAELISAFVEVHPPAERP